MFKESWQTNTAKGYYAWSHTLSHWSDFFSARLSGGLFFHFPDFSSTSYIPDPWCQLVIIGMRYSRLAIVKTHYLEIATHPCWTCSKDFSSIIDNHEAQLALKGRYMRGKDDWIDAGRICDKFPHRYGNMETCRPRKYLNNSNSPCMFALYLKRSISKLAK